MEDNQEINKIYEMQVAESQLNSNMNLKPQAYQMLYCEMAEKHLKAYHLGTDVTMQYDVAWVLISLTVEVKKPINETCSLFAKTWKSGLQGPYFRRDFPFSDENGELYFQGTSFSVLLNLETRKVCRDKKLPFFSMQAYDYNVTSGVPTWKSAYGKHLDNSCPYMQVSEERKVQNSFIDMLGHVNNIRYGEFVYDAMDEEEIRRLNKLSRLELYFESELRIGDTFTVSKEEADGNLCFRGKNETTGATSFDMVMTF